MTPAQEILALVEKLEATGKRADRMVCDLASGKEKWNMCVPPQESDTDMVLIEPIRALPSLLAVVRELVSGCVDGCYCVNACHCDDVPCGSCESLAKAAALLRGET